MLFLQGCGIVSSKYDVTPLVGSKGKSLIIPPSALRKCPKLNKKPSSRKVKDALTAWQRDRNNYKKCNARNNQKIEVIKNLQK
mgnify:CR=1 FL=1